MDPLSAILALATESLKFAAQVAEGQTPEQRRIIWDWYIKDVAWWRKALKIDV